MNSKQLLLCLAAGLALASCSSEPSDWRPDKKVSLDMVAPGTRSSQNFDQHTAEAPSQHKGGAITEPISSEVTLDEHAAPSAEQAMSANAEEVERTKKPADAAKINAKPSQADTTAGGKEVQR